MPQATGPYTGQPSQQNQILQAAAAKTATGTGTAVESLGEWYMAEFQLDLTAAATEAGDTLDVYVQTTIDGTNWIDVVHFTQCLGNGSAKRHIAKIVAGAAETMFEASATFSAGSVRNIVGDQYRVRWDITDASTANASFTFSVKANFQ